MTASDQITRFTESLAQNAADFQIELRPEVLSKLAIYFSFISRWNERLHLVAPCSAEEFATRHILESLLLVQYLSPNTAVADIGSGAGLPLIPCLIVRPDLSGYLIESAKRKSVFLHEVAKQTGVKARIINKRFQEIDAPSVQFVTCRAIEQFESLLPEMFAWVPPPCTVLLFGGEKLSARLSELGQDFQSQLIPHSERRFLYIVRKN